MLPHTVIRKVEVKCLRCALSDPHSHYGLLDLIMCYQSTTNQSTIFLNENPPLHLSCFPTGYSHPSHFSRAVRNSALYHPTGRSVCNVSSHVRVTMAGNLLGAQSSTTTSQRFQHYCARFVVLVLTQPSVCLDSVASRPHPTCRLLQTSCHYCVALAHSPSIVGPSIDDSTPSLRYQSTSRESTLTMAGESLKRIALICSLEPLYHMLEPMASCL